MRDCYKTYRQRFWARSTFNTHQVHPETDRINEWRRNKEGALAAVGDGCRPRWQAGRWTFPMRISICRMVSRKREQAPHTRVSRPGSGSCRAAAKSSLQCRSLGCAYVPNASPHFVPLPPADSPFDLSEIRSNSEHRQAPESLSLPLTRGPIK